MMMKFTPPELRKRYAPTDDKHIVDLRRITKPCTESVINIKDPVNIVVFGGIISIIFLHTPD